MLIKHCVGTKIRQSHARQLDLQQHQPQHQRAEDLQDRPKQGLRPEMHHPRDRDSRRAAPIVPISRIECEE